MRLGRDELRNAENLVGVARVVRQAPKQVIKRLTSSVLNEWRHEKKVFIYQKVSDLVLRDPQPDPPTGRVGGGVHRANP